MVPKYANTAGANVGAKIVEVLQFANIIDKNQDAKSVEVLQSVNIIKKNQGAKNAEGPIYAEIVGVTLEKTINTRVIACLAL